jgi:hypothetical protein
MNAQERLPLDSAPVRIDIEVTLCDREEPSNPEPAGRVHARFTEGWILTSQSLRTILRMASAVPTSKRAYAYNRAVSIAPW